MYQLQLGNVKAQMKTNLLGALERGDNLDSIEVGTQDLMEGAQRFNQTSSALKRMMCCKNIKVSKHKLCCSGSFYSGYSDDDHSCRNDLAHPWCHYHHRGLRQRRHMQAERRQRWRLIQGSCRQYRNVGLRVRAPGITCVF